MEGVLWGFMEAEDGAVHGCDKSGSSLVLLFAAQSEKTRFGDTKQPSPKITLWGQVRFRLGHL